MKTIKPRWPAVINGHRTRPEHGSCPECGASDTSWCTEECTLLDPKDYR